MTKTLSDHEPHTYRIRLHDAASRPHEVTAAYFAHEDGFVTFKDNAHAAVYAVAASAVQTIERLRTDVILAISATELEEIIGALEDRATFYRRDDDSTRLERVTATVEGLKRLRPLAKTRVEDDPCSLPRVAVAA